MEVEFCLTKSMNDSHSPITFAMVKLMMVSQSSSTATRLKARHAKYVKSMEGRVDVKRESEVRAIIVAVIYTHRPMCNI